jgi:transposase
LIDCEPRLSIVPMYIDRVPNRNSPPAVLLRESYREGPKVRKRTIANLSKCPKHAVDALEAALKGQTPSSYAPSVPLADQFEVIASPAHGHVAAVIGTLKRLGIPRLLDRSDSQERKIALALIASRILFPNSKLATLRLLAPGAVLKRSSSTSDIQPLVPLSTLAEELDLDINSLTLDDVYGAMQWLLARQPRLEKAFAKAHLHEGSLALYDLTSTYYEGFTCPLAKLGYNRDGKKGKLQINFGLLCDQSGRPISCEVFPGNVGDPSTVANQALKLRQQFGLRKVILVGDRGMITQARIDEDLQHLDGLAWISALNHSSVSALIKEGAFQPELFEDYGIAEIESSSYPGERLVVCFNPMLAKKRQAKREELLEVAASKLAAIREATQRAKKPYHGKDRIARRVERETGKYKMLKHYRLSFTETDFTFERNEESIKNESLLDGFYIIRAGHISHEEMDSDELVCAYKKLSEVEKAFRTFKSIDVRVRPIFHRDPDMVRAHIFLCMLAYYVEWHMLEALAPLLFVDEHKEEVRRQRKTAAHPMNKSPEAKRKAKTKTTAEGQPVQSFHTLMTHLSGVVRNRFEPRIKDIPQFTKVTIPDALQSRAFKLLGVEV